jgi:hypothetical protein
MVTKIDTTVKQMAAQELARIAWDKDAKRRDRLDAAEALQRQINKLIIQLTED